MRYSLRRLREASASGRAPPRISTTSRGLLKIWVATFSGWQLELSATAITERGVGSKEWRLEARTLPGVTPPARRAGNAQAVASYSGGPLVSTHEVARGGATTWTDQPSCFPLHGPNESGPGASIRWHARGL